MTSQQVHLWNPAYSNQISVFFYVCTVRGEKEIGKKKEKIKEKHYSNILMCMAYKM
jgi:hypothetical protein